MDMSMPRVTARKLVSLVSEFDTEEQCGFIMAGWKIVVADNVHSKPDHQFRFSDASILYALRDSDQACRGIFHSHYNGDPLPSGQDAENWHYGGRLRYWIVTPDNVYEWSMQNDIIHGICADGTQGQRNVAYPLLAATEEVRRGRERTLDRSDARRRKGVPRSGA